MGFGDLLETPPPSSMSRSSSITANRQPATNASTSGETSSVEEVPTIVRFKLLKQAVRAFEHASKRTIESWGDQEALRFRASLVAQVSDMRYSWIQQKRINKIKNSQLSDAQRAEFKLAFALFDHDSNGEVEPWELAKALSIFVSHHRHALFLAVRHR